MPGLKDIASIFLEIFFIQYFTILVAQFITSSLSYFPIYKNVNVFRTRKDISKRHSPVFWKASQITSNYFSFYTHFKQRIFTILQLPPYHGQRMSALACVRVKDTFIRELIYVKIFIQHKAEIWAYLKYENAISVWKTSEVEHKRLILGFKKWPKIRLCLHQNDLYNHQSAAYFSSDPLFLPVAEIRILWFCCCIKSTCYLSTFRAT